MYKNKNGKVFIPSLIWSFHLSLDFTILSNCLDRYKKNEVTILKFYAIKSNLNG